MPAVPGGRPARPVGRQQGRPPLSPATAGPRRRSPPGTPRPALPAFPSGRAGAPASTRPTPRPARNTTRAPAFLLLPGAAALTG